ncbi:hypothetical protein [Nocardia tengchongensis]|uniref:hypothetical protein n=1 Tax=Nocardia tengchongensis TaxID=2055889 RepID=UPI0036AEA598
MRGGGDFGPHTAVDPSTGQDFWCPECCGAADQPAGLVAFAAEEGQGEVYAFDLTEPSFVVCAVAAWLKVVSMSLSL